jgi:hypothetical protein
MPKVQLAVKNQYFQHFSVAGIPGEFRMNKQIWNARGLAMQIQGTNWDGGVNGFGKRHLITTEGSTHYSSAEDKARGVAFKRRGNSSQGRSVKLGTMVSSLAPRTNINMQDAAARNAQTQLEAATRQQLQRGYETAAYGPQTNTSSFILLDGLDKQEVEAIFADSILAAGAWSPGDAKHVTILFDDARVIQIADDYEVTRFYGADVTVKLHNQVYYIYHLNKAVEPEDSFGLGIFQ